MNVKIAGTKNPKYYRALFMDKIIKIMGPKYIFPRSGRVANSVIPWITLGRIA